MTEAGEALQNGPSNTAIKVVELDTRLDFHALHRLAPDRYPFLLQSTAGTSGLGRFDILFAFPGEFLELDANAGLRGQLAGGEKGFLDALDRCWMESAAASVDAHWPFTGGWFLYLSYELAAEIEPALSLQADSVLPVALAVRCPAAVIRDHDTDRCVLLHEADADVDAQIVHDDIVAATTLANTTSAAAGWCPLVAEQSPHIFLDAVGKAKQYIARGDIYQANLSRGWSAEMDQPIDAN
ncbi:MAG: aminodeoxychorismate synthase, component I, partial [Gammaproteobacteria bacterium]|nr:aminodeoxychorismate synthase, component I [Gammaproteobacteria bacterium]